MALGTCNYFPNPVEVVPDPHFSRPTLDNEPERRVIHVQVVIDSEGGQICFG